jgi:hypothetical protein
MIKACNPAVWNATVTTMRMSAFFRYIKKNYAKEWNRFTKEIQDAAVFPATTTPTVLYEKGNSKLDNIFGKK